MPRMGHQEGSAGNFFNIRAFFVENSSDPGRIRLIRVDRVDRVEDGHSSPERAVLYFSDLLWGRVSCTAKRPIFSSRSSWCRESHL